MKGLPSTVLALVFVLFALISLWITPHASDSRNAAVSEDSARISEVGLRIVFQR